jgi:hypothetical protein
MKSATVTEPPGTYPSGPWFNFKRLTWYRLLRKLRKLRDKRLAPPMVLRFDLTGQAASDRVRTLRDPGRADQTVSERRQRALVVG